MDVRRWEHYSVNHGNVNPLGLRMNTEANIHSYKHRLCPSCALKCVCVCVCVLAEMLSSHNRFMLRKVDMMTDSSWIV